MTLGASLENRNNVGEEPLPRFTAHLGYAVSSTSGDTLILTPTAPGPSSSTTTSPIPASS